MNQQLSNCRSWSVVPMLGAVLACAVMGCAKKSDHAGFASADDAVSAMIDAARKSDRARLRELFGPGSDSILASGDAVADESARSDFIAKYDAKHALAPAGDGSVILQVGTEDWPFPVPVVQRDGEWYLDGAGGADEIVYRRIGRNELGAIAVCRGYVDAQHEYAAADHDGEGAGIFAHKLVSDPGTQNGLYWESAAGEPESPVGPFVAAASAEGYRTGGGEYHGYRYRPLFSQTDNANGGALDYFDKGVLRNGFALIAWPAEYGVSGIMTFIVNHDGVVFQKDLGDDTGTAVATIDAYDPDSTLGRRHRKRLKGLKGTFTFVGSATKVNVPFRCQRETARRPWRRSDGRRRMTG